MSVFSLIAAVGALVKAIEGMRIGRPVRDADARYCSRKFVTFIGYVVAILAVGALFSIQFGTLTVAFGGTSVHGASRCPWTRYKPSHDN